MKTPIEASSIPKIPGARITILKSKMYPDIVGGMSDVCRDLLSQAGCTEIVEHVMPGSLEMPLAAKVILSGEAPKPDALVCIGVIIKGDTFHFEMITREIIRGLGSVSLEHCTPIIVEILPVSRLQEAAERARPDRYNKGIEAAVAAAEMVSWRRSMHEGNPA